MPLKQCRVKQMKLSSRRIVIDADVVCAAGGEAATNELSRSCRDFLRAVHDICHRAVLSTELAAEWKKHQSKFTRKWRRWMDGKKKLSRRDCPANHALRSKVSAVLTESERNEAEKDFHLVEAALATDKIVISCEDKARGLFAKASASVPELADIMWVNVRAQAPGNLEVWLKGGAAMKKEYCLGS